MRRLPWSLRNASQLVVETLGRFADAGVAPGTACEAVVADLTRPAVAALAAGYTVKTVTDNYAWARNWTRRPGPWRDEVDQESVPEWMQAGLTRSEAATYWLDGYTAD